MTPYQEYRQTPIWPEIEKSIKELINNDDLELKTQIDYVIGYITKNLVDKGLII